jgi:enamine deaminase RidA (YjgF/YER057c/UK114 family)
LNLSQKLSELKVTIPVAAKPVAAYVPAVKVGNLVFVAGQLPLVDGKIPKTGKVSNEVSIEEAKELAKVCALNCLAAINLVSNIEKITKIVRVGGFVNTSGGFIQVPAVINGASEFLIELFGEEIGKHARTAVGVVELPLDAPVEIDMVVEVD